MCDVVARVAAAAACAAVVLATPAGAAVPNTATANDGRLRAGCTYVRTTADLDLATVEIRAWATAPPDGSIRLTCTVSASSTSGSVSNDGAVVVTAEGSALLGAGTTTVCVEATASYTIDVPPNSVSHCETFDN